MKLEGKVVLITGANRGIGRGCALEMAKEGANIIVNYREHGGEAEEVAQMVKSLGRDSLVIQADVSQRAQVEAMVKRALDHFGAIDVLVNNAASSVRKPFVELSVEDVEQTWGVTLWGPFHCTQVVAREWVQKKKAGNIIMISSIHSTIPFPTSLPYNCAKAALNHMALTLAAELAPHHIRVNVIEPGWTDTPGERRFLSEEELQEKAKRLPWGRMGTSEEIGKAAVFLASDDSDYISGAVLRVDGALAINYATAVKAVLEK
jgi:glucose 1-dehydrogenase